MKLPDPVEVTTTALEAIAGRHGLGATEAPGPRWKDLASPVYPSTSG